MSKKRELGEIPSPINFQDHYYFAIANRLDYLCELLEKAIPQLEVAQVVQEVVQEVKPVSKTRSTKTKKKE